MSDDQDVEQQDDAAATETDVKPENGERDDPAAALKATLTKVRGEKRTAEQALRTAQQELAALKGKDTGDVERLTTERDALRADLDKTTARVKTVLAEQQVRDAAAEAGVKPERLKALYRIVRDDLETDDDGTATNLDDAIKAAKKDAPELFRAGGGKADGGAKDEREPGTDMNDNIRSMARKKR